MTLTRSKVKIKVTGLLNFRQLAKPCMLAAMTAAPLRGFLVEFPSIKTVQTSSKVDISRNSNGHISVVRDAVGHAAIPTRTVYADVILSPIPIQGQGQGHGAFELPTIAHNFIFLRLSPPPFSRGAQN